MGKNNSRNVSVGKPKAGGAIFRAPIGTTLPVNATAALPEAFVCLGLCSEDGLVETEERSTEKHNAWGSDAVGMSQTSYSKRFKFTPLETSKEVLETRYGTTNVVVSEDDSGIEVHHNAKTLDHFAWVFEIVLENNRVLRRVLSDGQVTEVGDVSYVDGQLIGYELTLDTYPDSAGDYVVDYYSEVA